MSQQRPDILAPAGDRPAFLAALAAGADAVYCGLKAFSARMTARNFSLDELAALTRLAHRRGVSVYVAFNTLVKPNELQTAGLLVKALEHQVGPDALIVQDPALPALARQAGFTGQLHLSTLANVGFGAALKLVRDSLQVDRVVIPRELNVEEIQALGRACPPDLELEAFVHGALCYAVSGRCYWSSFLGGRSGLRGRCVQPCRRVYRQGQTSGRLFSCLDLSLDVLVKVLRRIPQVRTWKIEGRRKSAHYVYYTVSAYRMLRDQGHEAAARRAALGLLEMALGRKGSHANFLPHRPWLPLAAGDPSGSGFFLGRLQGAAGNIALKPRIALLRDDRLRIGTEDQPWHRTVRVSRNVPAGGRLSLKVPGARGPVSRIAVFLTDRREPALAEEIDRLAAQLDPVAARSDAGRPFVPVLPTPFRGPRKVVEMHVVRGSAPGVGKSGAGRWLGQSRAGGDRKTWWWLPPVIWPAEEERFRRRLARLLGSGQRQFVLNAPWQIAFFSQLESGANLWAGPFCNLANGLALQTLADLGFNGAVVSPELGGEDLLNLPRQSPLPLGVVIAGYWPLCISRLAGEHPKPGRIFRSPKGEAAWLRRYGDSTWVYPNWELNLGDHRRALEKAGYRLFVHLHEPVPPKIDIKKRPGLWNWKHGLR